MKTFRVVQPWGKVSSGQVTTVSEHDSAEKAFAEIDRLADQMLRNTGRADVVRLIVIDDAGNEARRTSAN